MAANPNLEKECLDWYTKNRELYRACAGSVHRLLTTLLEQAGIPFHSIQYRVKDQKSFLDKCMKPRYKSPLEEITDVCGLRIITYTNKDVDDICKIIEKHFSIDPEKSINKADLLHANEVGYLSVHYIAKLNQPRVKLDEYKPYSNICFEIQVRTLLQHAWAEIEHDRSYKFSGELPQDIKRRFFLVAGTLELMDREFNLLAHEIDQYAATVHSEAKSGNLDFAIDSTSLFEYLKVKLKDYPDVECTFCDGDKEIVQELNDCGFTTLASLDKIMDETIIKAVLDASNSAGGTNYIGFLRGMMMVTVPKLYFEKAWQHHWGGIKIEEFNYLASINSELKNFDRLIDLIP